MGAYFIRRLLLMIPTFIGITFMVFAVTRFVPGGPIDQMLLQWQAAASEAGGGAAGTIESTVEIPDAVLAALQEHYHLDMPFYQAYFLWLADVVTLDLGKVVAKGITPRVNTGIAHKEAGVGQIGAGLVGVLQPTRAATATEIRIRSQSCFIVSPSLRFQLASLEHRSFACFRGRPRCGRIGRPARPISSRR